MDPVTLTGVSMAATAIGGGVSAFGSLMGGDSARAMYQYRAGVATLNQKIAKQNADYSRKVGEVQATESGMRSRFQIGKIQAAQGASGVDVNSGSPAAVRASQTEIAQMDQGIIRSNAARRAYGYEVEAAKDKAEAGMDIAAGDQARTASRITAATSILGTAASVSNKWLQASQYGVFSDSGSGGVVGPTEGDYYEA